MLGQFTGVVDENGMHITLQPSAEYIQLAGENGVAVEELTQLLGTTGGGRGLNPANSIEVITCGSTTGCAAQYGSIVVPTTYAPASGSYSAACGTVPAGRSTTCYAADVEIREFIEQPLGTQVEISNVYAIFNGTGSTGGANTVLPYSGTPETLGAPTSLNSTTYRYGSLEPGPTGVASLDSPFHQSSVRRWRFSYPTGTSDFNFTFNGNIYATVATGRAPYQASVSAVGGPTSTAFTSGCISDNGDYHVGTSVESTSGQEQVWLHRRRTGDFQWVSRSTAGALGNGTSANPCISPDGSVVVFDSTSTNLAATDANARPDIFARVVSTGATEHISRDSSGVGGTSCGATGLGATFPSISADSRYVAFSSTCSSFCTGNTECTAGRPQVYRRDRVVPGLIGVSRPNGSNTSFAAAAAQTASISGDGNLVAFQSAGTNLTGDIRNVVDVFVRNIATSATWRISNDAGTGYKIPQISRSGSHVIFTSTSRTFVTGVTDTTDLDVFRCTVSATPVCSYASLNNASTTVSGVGESGSATLVGAAISADGNLVAFQSDVVDLVTGDTNAITDIFVRNMTTNATTRISVNSSGVQGNGASTLPRFSTNSTGRTYVTFTSASSNLLFDSAGTGSFDDGDGPAVDAFSIRF